MEPVRRQLYRKKERSLGSDKCPKKKKKREEEKTEKKEVLEKWKSCPWGKD